MTKLEVAEAVVSAMVLDDNTVPGVETRLEVGIYKGYLCVIIACKYRMGGAFNRFIRVSKADNPVSLTAKVNAMLDSVRLTVSMCLHLEALKRY